MKFLVFFLVTAFFAGASAQASQTPLYFSFEQRLRISLALEIASTTGDQRQAAVEFAKARKAARQVQTVSVKTFEEFLDAWKGPWPGTNSLSLDLQILKSQNLPAQRTFVSNDAKVQQQINDYIGAQNARLVQAFQEMGISSGLLGSASPQTLLTSGPNMMAGKTMITDTVNHISQTAGDFIDFYFKDVKDPSLKIAMRTVFTTYYPALGVDSKKQLASALLGSDLEADRLSHFMTLLQNSGPQLQKMLQIIALQSDIPPDLIALLKQLESGVRSVPWVQVNEIVNSEISNYNFVSVNHEPLGVGTMAQVHRARLRVAGGKVQDVVVRFIKPGMPDRVDEDERILTEIARRLDANPQYRATGASLMTPLVQDLAATVRAELDLPATVARQTLAMKVYEKSFKVKASTQNLTVRYHVPAIFPAKGPSRLHVQEAVNGTKLDRAVMSMDRPAEAKRLIAETTARLFLQEVLTGSGFYHADLHQGNFMVDVQADGQIVINILDYGMGGQLTRDMQDRLIILGAAVTINSADKIAKTYWDLSNKDKNTINEQLFRKLVAEQVTRLNAAGKIWSNDMWAIFAIDRGLAMPYDFVNMNRAFVIIDRMLQGVGSKETVGSLSNAVVRGNIFRTLKMLWSKGKFSMRDLARLGFSKTAVDTTILAPAYEPVVQAVPATPPGEAGAEPAPLRCEQVFL